MQPAPPPLPSRALQAAFLSATYGPPQDRWQLCAGLNWQGQPPAWAKVSGWGAITAWNPGGQASPLADNQRAAAALAARAQALELTAQPGLNGSGKWAEPGLLLACTLREAAALGREFGQLAVVWGAGRRAGLVWLLPGRAAVQRYWLCPVNAERA